MGGALPAVVSVIIGYMLMTSPPVTHRLPNESNALGPGRPVKFCVFQRAGFFAADAARSALAKPAISLPSVGAFETLTHMCSLPGSAVYVRVAVVVAPL